MNTNQIFMQRAFELARLGLGEVSPNPMVGCVIVQNETIIGEGWHMKYGGPHAEVKAINSVADQKSLIGSTAYVNLEPCSHHGKTPPCADMLIKHGIKKVVIGNRDPNPLVGNLGITRLKKAGIEVITDLLAEEGRELNKRFFAFYKKKRPYIILKWAQTQDGFMARKDFSSKWISNEYSRRLVHQWRAQEDALLIGTNTAKYDNPQLNVRNVHGNDPLRIVIDTYLKLESHLAIFDQSQPTICYNRNSDKRLPNLEYVKLPSSSITEILTDLHERNILSIIVEGGARLIGSFIEDGLWDEARVFTSSQEYSEGIEAPPIRGNLICREQLQGDTLEVHRKPH